MIMAELFLFVLDQVHCKVLATAAVAKEMRKLDSQRSHQLIFNFRMCPVCASMRLKPGHKLNPARFLLNLRLKVNSCENP